MKVEIGKTEYQVGVWQQTARWIGVSYPNFDSYSALFATLRGRENGRRAY